jgi:beta-xylosidase
MYGTTALKEHTIQALNTFSVYKTYDLENFEEGKIIFDGSDHDFFGTKDYWAPEVHKYNGKYYLFGSVKADGVCRATHIFVCDTPDGKFVPVSNSPITPANWECLDGTFWQENGKPYMIFSHEWLQVKDGEICAVELNSDLTGTVGEPKLLFRASDNPCVNEIGEKGSGDYVTDGPFLFKEDGKLKMIWSSFYKGRYCVLEAQSDSLFGSWSHLGSKFDFDGGHAMIFYTLSGERMISLHSPNTNNLERAHFIKY